MLNRQKALAAGALALSLIIGGSAQAADQPGTLRLGYQKAGILVVARNQQVIEKRLGAKGIETSWIEFTSGPPLLEAMNAGRIDIGLTGGSGALLAEGAAGAPQGRSEGAGAVQEALPGLIEGLAREHTGKRIELWFMDEARVGQKGGVTHVWYPKGVRPRGVRRQGSGCAYLCGAVCAERGEGMALVLREVWTAAMDVFLAELARAVPAGSRTALVLDGAGWHVSEDLTVPAT